MVCGRQGEGNGDPRSRWEWGNPPRKQGDYAYLLHIIRAMKSTGKGACILPHGVLFRGNAEADIRTALVKSGYLKGIIGLPPNLFFGTGIAACILALDKENAASRKGIFMIDASKGFIKDGPKNRLREQDLHRITDTFTRGHDIHGNARMVPCDEIADDKNAFNLNLPRYLPSAEAEDLQDIAAHLHGGLPQRDIDALAAYWRARTTPRFRAFTTGHLPKSLIHTLSEDLLNAYHATPLVNPYDIFQHLMEYWADPLQDGLYLISDQGWVGAATPREIDKIKYKEGKLVWPEPGDILIGKRRFTSDLIPAALIVARYFAPQQAAMDGLHWSTRAGCQQAQRMRSLSWPRRRRLAHGSDRPTHAPRRSCRCLAVHQAAWAARAAQHRLPEPTGAWRARGLRWLAPSMEIRHAGQRRAHRPDVLRQSFPAISARLARCENRATTARER